MLLVSELPIGTCDQKLWKTIWLAVEKIVMHGTERFFQRPDHRPLLQKKCFFIMLKLFSKLFIQNYFCKIHSGILKPPSAPSSSLLMCLTQCEVLKLTKTHREFTTHGSWPHTLDFSLNWSIARWVLALHKSTKITIRTIKDNGKCLTKKSFERLKGGISIVIWTWPCCNSTV